jgi:neurotransmitter:Na+ symporter, NSS family
MNNNVTWSSRFAFIFATASAAIGLGNIWRFPYLAGQNGGGAFVLFYLLCVLVLGFPLLYAEVILGRLGKANPVKSIKSLSLRSNASGKWAWLGMMFLLAGFLILTYYVVIVGWVLDYAVRSVLGEFRHVTLAVSQGYFTNMKSSHWQMLLTDSLVVLGAVIIIQLGVKRGLERAVMIMFPLLLVLMLLLLCYSAAAGDFVKALNFLFYPNFHSLTPKIMLVALGQAFFSLNIAMGVTLMFSAYLPDNHNLLRNSFYVAIADTGFALLAGMIIFPVVFGNHLPVSSGPSLIFQTLPLAFAKMPFGWFVSVLFFIMLFFAAFSSIISIMEPSVNWLMGYFNASRSKVVWLIGLVCWLLSLGTIGSFSHATDFSIYGVTFFKAIDFITSAVMLPLGGVLLAIFCGWILDQKILENEFDWKLNGLVYKTWKTILCYVSPCAIILVLLMACGII